MTNLEKWNYWKDIIDAREKAFTDTEVKDVPTSLYYVNPSGSIGEKVITGVYYSNGKYFSFNKRPTKNDVEKVRSFAENPEQMSRENIFYSYEEKHKFGKASGAVRINEVGIYLTKKDAEIKAEEVKKKIKAEELLLQNGHVRCDRCRTVVPENTIITRKIISYATYGPAGRIMKFCSGTCAAHEQWAHEG